MASFVRRMPTRRVSTSTMSSLEAQEIMDQDMATSMQNARFNINDFMNPLQRNTDSGLSNTGDLPGPRQQIRLDQCNDIRINEQSSRTYYNLFTQVTYLSFVSAEYLF